MKNIMVLTIKLGTAGVHTLDEVCLATFSSAVQSYVWSLSKRDNTQINRLFYIWIINMTSSTIARLRKHIVQLANFSTNTIRKLRSVHVEIQDTKNLIQFL